MLTRAHLRGTQAHSPVRVDCELLSRQVYAKSILMRSIRALAAMSAMTEAAEPMLFRG